MFWYIHNAQMYHPVQSTLFLAFAVVLLSLSDHFIHLKIRFANIWLYPEKSCQLSMSVSLVPKTSSGKRYTKAGLVLYLVMAFPGL